MEAVLTRLGRLVAEVESNYVAEKAVLLEELAGQLEAGLLVLTELTSESNERGSKGKCMMEACSMTLKKLAVRIWNESVCFTQKHNGSLSGAVEAGNRLPIPEFSIRLRQVASEMLLVAVKCYESDAPTVLYSYAVKFSAKMGKMWADDGKREKANGCWDRILCMLRDPTKEEDSNKWGFRRIAEESVTVAEPLLQLCIWKAECNLNGQIEVAEDAARMAIFLASEKSLDESEEEKMLLYELAVLLYNLGMRTMRRLEGKGENAVRWFLEVLSLHRDRNASLDVKFRAHVFRALVRCSLDEVGLSKGPSKDAVLEKAKRYLEQAQELEDVLTNQLLLIELHWMAGKKEGDVLFEEMLKGRKIKLSGCQSLMSAVVRSGRSEIVGNILEKLIKGEGWNESELSEFRLMQFELLVNAWKVVENTEQIDCCLERVMGDCIRRCGEREMTAKNKQRLYVLCWELATESYKAKRWTEAIRWFKKVLKIDLSWTRKGEGVELKAKCLCLLAKCHLNLESLEEALECGKLALEMMPTFLPGLAILFELYLKQDKVEGIHEVISRVMKLDEVQWERSKEVILSPIYLIELLIGQALEYQRGEVALKVLEALLIAIGSREKTILQRLTLSYGFVLRTALKMMWTKMVKSEECLEEDVEGERGVNREASKGVNLKVVKWINRAGYLIRKASQVLKKVDKVLFFGSSSLTENSPCLDEELIWMSYYSFNLAIKAQEYKLFENAHDLFIESAHFCKYTTETGSVESLKQQRKCRVLAISSILLMHTSSPCGSSCDVPSAVREDIDSPRKKKGLEGALQHVLLCYRLTERISEILTSATTGEVLMDADKTEMSCSNVEEGGRLFEDEKSMRVMLFLLDFELRVLLRHPSQELFSLLNSLENLAEPHMMIRVLENLSWFVWERYPERYSLRLVALELCYRLDTLYRKSWSGRDLSSPGQDLLTCLSNLRRAVSLCPDKSESLHIYERIFGLLDLKDGTKEEENTNSDMQRQILWLMIEAYNNGVYYSRLGKYELSARWLTTAISLLPHYAQKNEFEEMFREAHEQVIKKL